MAGVRPIFSVWALTPGLVDLHCHGGQGFDPELNERPLPEFLTILLCHGVTDVLLTLGAEPLPTMRRALAVVQTAMQQQAAGKLPGAHILGVHLEGPFLSPERPGAMPPAALLPPTLAAYQTLVQGYESVIRQVTLAPELPGALELGAALAARGIRVQAGTPMLITRPPACFFCWIYRSVPYLQRLPPPAPPRPRCGGRRSAGS